MMENQNYIVIQHLLSWYSNLFSRNDKTWQFSPYFQDKLSDIITEYKAKEGKGYCDCPGCTEDGSGDVFPDNCPDLTEKCKRFETVL